MTSQAPYPAFVGGFGSGKTAAAMARAMALKVMCRQQNIAYYLPTYPLIKDIAFERFPELCERKGWAYRLNQQDSELVFPDAGKIIFRNMEQPGRIVGYEVAHSLVDEIDIMATDKAAAAWNKIIARNRQKCGMPNTVGVATTPEGFKFVYERWEKNPSAGYVLFRAKTSENAANLPADYITNLQGSYNSSLQQAYLDGEFVNLTAGSVYAEFDRHLNNCSTEIQTSEPLHIGMDFNVGNMHAVVNVLRDGDPHAVEELTGILDTPAMIATIKSRYVGHSILVYPDASGNSRKSNNASESDIALLRAAGFNVLVAPSNPAVKDRVLAMNQMICMRTNADPNAISSLGLEVNDGSVVQRRMRVNVDRCPVLVEALEKQAYDKNGEPDKAGGLDHAPDAQGYFIFYRFPVRGRAMQQIRIGGI
ncbi:MAG: terminase family protein [Novosphingobium sp.]|nr:terminase family protein [Novosphingobium sp.]